MAGFQYIIKDSKGARTEGVVKAGTMDEAIDKLTQGGATIISVKSSAEGGTHMEEEGTRYTHDIMINNILYTVD